MAGPETAARPSAQPLASPEERIKALEARAADIERRLYTLDVNLQRVIGDARRARRVPTKE